MEPLERIGAVAAPLPLDNIDTDQILPARFLSRRRENGYGDFCFRDLRFAADGEPRSEFPLNQPGYRGAGVLITGANFGCGSSREGAVYALIDAGIRAVIAESFGDIFYQNALVNGLLAIRLSAEKVKALAHAVAEMGMTTMSIDVVAQTVEVGPIRFDFAIDPFKKHCLVNGIDEIDFTMQFADRISAFERTRPR